jgi:hypothetical protein
MATRTATKSGLLTDETVWGAAAPVDGDTMDIAGFTIIANKSVALASLISNGGSIVPIRGHEIDITAATLTGHLKITGPARSYEYTNATAGLTGQGVGGIG